jgi:hypothetical protein
MTVDPTKLYAVVMRPLDSLDLTDETTATTRASEMARDEPGTAFLVVEVVSQALTPIVEGNVVFLPDRDR